MACDAADVLAGYRPAHYYVLLVLMNSSARSTRVVQQAPAGHPGQRAAIRAMRCHWPLRHCWHVIFEVNSLIRLAVLHTLCIFFELRYIMIWMR